jgi:hypothetical protein
VIRNIFIFPHLGEGLAFAKRTLPRKKPNAIDHYLFNRNNGICLFDSPPDTKGLARCIPPDVGMRVQTSRSALFYGLYFLGDSAEFFEFASWVDLIPRPLLLKEKGSVCKRVQIVFRMSEWSVLSLITGWHGF